MTSKNDRTHPFFWYSLVVKMTKSVVPESCLSLTTGASCFFSFRKDWNVSKRVKTSVIFFRRGFVGGCALVDFIYFDFDCPLGCKGMPGANHSTGPRRNYYDGKSPSFLFILFAGWKTGKMEVILPPSISTIQQAQNVLFSSLWRWSRSIFFFKNGWINYHKSLTKRFDGEGNLIGVTYLTICRVVVCQDVHLFLIAISVHNLCFYLRLFWPTLLVLTLQLAIWVRFGYRFAALLKWPNLGSYRIQRENSRSACGVFSPGNDETYPDTNGFQENHPLKNAGW